MKNQLLIVSLIISTMIAMVSCNDTDTTIGSNLVEDKVEIVMDSSFVLTGNSVVNPRVQSRTVTHLLGKIEATGYGDFSSDVVTQFMPGVVLDVESFTADDIDSVKLILKMNKGAFTGDSLTPMGLRVYPLTKSLPSPIYSDFDPTEYYDKTQCWGSTVYTASALGQSDSIMALKTRSIEVMLPREFAVKMYDKYKNDASVFQTPQTFAAWFPGLYIANSFGNGRITRIDNSYITMYYHVHSKSTSTGNDTIINYSNTYLAVTPEIVTNNNIEYKVSADLSQRVENGETLLVAPTGYDVEVKFPAEKIIETYRKGAGPIAMLNSLSMEIPVETIDNKYGINPPSTVLFIKKSKLNEFFAKNMITDGVNAFYASYDKSKKRYVFSDMRDYLYDLLEKDEVKAEDTEFVITPINVVTETSGSGSYASTVVTQIVPYITNPVMVRLLLDQAKIKLTFSKQTVQL